MTISVRESGMPMTVSMNSPSTPAVGSHTSVSRRTLRDCYCPGPAGHDRMLASRVLAETAEVVMRMLGV
jgi:hypothetical protein